MRKRLLGILQYVFFLSLGIFIIWWSLRKVDAQGWAEMKTAFLTARYTLLIPVVIALLASHYSRAIRWKILIEPLGYSPKITNTYLAVLVGYMANLAFPRLGEVLKCTILARYEKVPADKLVGTIVAERAFDVICLIIVIAIAFFTQTTIIGEYLGERISQLLDSKDNDTSSYKKYIVIGSILIGILLVWFLLKKFAHVSLVKKIIQIARGVWGGLTSVRLIKQKGWFVFHTIFIWAMYLISVRIGMYALQETSVYGFKPSISVLSTGSIAMILAPAGIGFYPYFVEGTMSLYGLKESIGYAFGSLMWAVQFFQQLVFGFIAILLLPYLNKNKKNEKSSTYR